MQEFKHAKQIAMSHDIDHNLRNVIYRHDYEQWKRDVSEESEL